MPEAQRSIGSTIPSEFRPLPRAEDHAPNHGPGVRPGWGRRMNTLTGYPAQAKLRANGACRLRILSAEMEDRLGPCTLRRSRMRPAIMPSPPLLSIAGPSAGIDRQMEKSYRPSVCTSPALATEEISKRNRHQLTISRMNDPLFGYDERNIDGRPDGENALITPNSIAKRR